MCPGLASTQEETVSAARRFAALAAVAAALLGPAAAQASAAPSDGRHVGIGIRLVDAPSSLVDDPRAHAYVIDGLAPGATITRHVEVTNDTGHAAHLLLYADAATVEDGQFAPAAGETANELTSWTTVTPSAVDLPQGGRATATVVVRVPQDASRGERYAAVIADLPPAGGPGVRVRNRVGVRMYIDVGHGAPKVDFTIDTLTAQRDADGRPVVQAQVHNTGERALDMRGTLALSDGPGGLSAGPFPAKLGTTLAPGQSEPVAVPLDDALPAGPWHARIALRSGLLSRTAEGDITFPAAAGTSAPPVEAHPVPLTRDRHVLVPLAVGLVVALLLVLGLLLWWRRRQRDGDDDAPGAGGPPRIPGQRQPPRLGARHR